MTYWLQLKADLLSLIVQTQECADLFRSGGNWMMTYLKKKAESVTDWGHSLWPLVQDTEDKKAFFCVLLEGRLELDGSPEHETQRGTQQSRFCLCSSEHVVLMMENELEEILRPFHLYSFTKTIPLIIVSSQLPHSVQIHLTSSYLIGQPFVLHPCPHFKSFCLFLFKQEEQKKKKAG